MLRRGRCDRIERHVGGEGFVTCLTSGGEGDDGGGDDDGGGGDDGGGDDDDDG